MLLNNWQNLSIETLIAAIENEYPEGKELEFKRHQNPSNSGHKQTTVGEVVSFANASGGDMVIGMADKERVASGLWPTHYDDLDDTILRWIDIIKRNTDPEIPQHLLEFEDIQVSEEHGKYVDDDSPSATGTVLVVRVQRSWRSPHRETVKNRFYERSSGGKSELDTGAIRRAMLQGDLVVERAREFRDDRLAAIQANDVVVPLAPRPKVVIHAVPSNAFAAEGTIDPSAATRGQNPNKGTRPALLGANSVRMGQGRYTEDGYLHARETMNQRDGFATYTQTFRSGVVEAATVSSYNNPEGGHPYIASGHVENCLEMALPTYIGFLSQHGGAFPLYCYISLVGARGLPVGSMRMAAGPQDPMSVVSSDIARPPAVQVESPEPNYESIIHSLVDSLHHASGTGSRPRVVD